MLRVFIKTVIGTGPWDLSGVCGIFALMTRLLCHVTWRPFLGVIVVGLSLISPDPARAQALAPQLPSDLECLIPVRDVLAEWETTGETFQDAGGPLGGRAWRLPTRRLGTWVAVNVDPWAMPTLSRVDEDSTTRIRFGPGCAPVHSRERAAASAESGGAFGDADLAALVSDGAAGVIYVWSPHMPLSVDAYRHITRAAKDLNVPLTALLDPAVDPGYARATAETATIPETALRPFRSVELMFRNATVHAPSLLMYAHGRMLGLAVPGYRDAAGYRAVIEHRLKSAGDSADREGREGREGIVTR